MNSFNQLMTGFGVVTVMNAKIYKLCTENYLHNTRPLTPFDFEDTGLYLDTLKFSNLIQEGPTKTIVGGQYSTPLIKYGKKTTLEMQNAIGNIEVLKTFFGCDYDENNHIVSVTDKFPSAFAIEGETFFIDQKTGEKKSVWIFIPQFLPDGVFNLTQDSEGDVAVFDCNGSVNVTCIQDPAHPNGYDIFYHIAEKPWLRFGYTINNNLDYQIDDRTGTYIVKGLTVDSYEGDLVIPALHEGTRVTIIDDYAFDAARKPNIKINNVYIANSIIKIGESAFAGQSNLYNVKFGNNSALRFIYDEAFADTTKLTYCNLPSLLRFIGTNAFYRSGIIETEGIYTYVGNWLVGSNENEDINTQEYSDFRDTIVGVADFALPQLEGNIKPLPRSVVYVGKQEIGCALEDDRYTQTSPFVEYAYLRKMMPVEESPGNYIDSSEKYAVTYCVCENFTEKLLEDLYNNICFISDACVIADLQVAEPFLSLALDFSLYKKMIINPNCFEPIGHSSDYTSTITVLNKAKQEAILEGSPWGLDTFYLNGPYKVTVTIKYVDDRDAVPDIYEKDDTGQT